MAMPRFLKVPTHLYRIQGRLPVYLRDFEFQRQQGRTSFDLKLHGGLVKPIIPGTAFETPNGMSLRPLGTSMLNILQNFRGNPMIYCLHEGIDLPDGLVLYHEHSDHYSLQTSEDISLPDLNRKLTQFLESLPCETKEEMLYRLHDDHDQDN